MTFFDSVKWADLFVPSQPLLETFLRGTIVYLALVFLMRCVFRRQTGTVAMTDLLVVVLIADAAQNAMAGDYKSIPDGVLLVATIIAWSYALDWLGYYFPAIGRSIHPPPLELIRDGRLLRRNMQHELITKDELMSQLREQGVENVADVKLAMMEGDGQISVIRRDEEQHPKHRENYSAS